MLSGLESHGSFPSSRDSISRVLRNDIGVSHHAHILVSHPRVFPALTRAGCGRIHMLGCVTTEQWPVWHLPQVSSHLGLGGIYLYMTNHSETQMPKTTMVYYLSQFCAVAEAQRGGPAVLTWGLS